MAGARIQHWGSTSSASVVWIGAAAAMGLSNLWRLPLAVNEPGGLIFLTTYFITLMLLAWPLMSAELLLGRAGGSDLLTGVHSVVRSAGIPAPWILLSLPVIVCATMAAALVALFLGWMLGALPLTWWPSGTGSGHSATGAIAEMTRRPVLSMGLIVIGLIPALALLLRPAERGVIRIARWTVPALLAGALLLFLFATDRADVGNLMTQFLLWPAADQIWVRIADGLREGFFTMSLGLGVFVVLGGMLPDDVRLSQVSARIIVLDTVFLMLAGGAMLLLLSDAPETAVAGPALLFDQLPRQLGETAGGRGLLTLIYLLGAVVSLFSLTLLLQPLQRSLMSLIGLPWAIAALSSAAVVGLLAVIALLSIQVAGPLPHLTDEYRGMVVFEWLQWLSAHLLVPVNALLICLLVSRMLPAAMLRKAWGKRHGVGYFIWNGAMRYPVRVLLILLCLYTTGILDSLTALWDSGPVEPA